MEMMSILPLFPVEVGPPVLTPRLNCLPDLAMNVVRGSKDVEIVVQYYLVGLQVRVDLVSEVRACCTLCSDDWALLEVMVGNLVLDTDRVTASGLEVDL